RAGRGAVALPQLDRTVDDGLEVQLAVEDGEEARVDAAKGSDVGEHYRAGRGAVALPELIAVRPVGGGVIQRAVEGREFMEIGAEEVPGVEVREPGGAGRGPVTLPELVTVARLITGVVDRPVQNGQGVAAGRAEDRGRPGRRAVALPE